MERPVSRILAGLLAASLATPAGFPTLAHAGFERAPLSEGDAAGAPAPALPPGVSGDWWSQVQRDIRDSEYRVTWQEKTALPEEASAYQAPNRAQNLRTYFAADGVRLVPRTAAGPPWQVGLSLASVGVGRRLLPVGAAKLETSGNRVEYRRRGITEWYVNDERGLEQGFTIAKRPGKGAEPLRLTLSVSGNTALRLSAEGQAVEFVAPGKAVALRYAELLAVDARGNRLASRMELRGCAGEEACALHLVVRDASATYPVTIDPLASNPNWTAESNQASAYFGMAVGTAGDVNGDGYADVIVGASGYDNGQSSEGRAYVYHGSASGLALAASWTAESNQAFARFGASVGAAGDVNGDGYADVIVGAPEYDNGQQGEGRAYVYHGSASGLSLSASWTAESDQADAYLGVSVGTAGDVNGDGYADVIVGASWADNGQVNEGLAYVYHGSASGLSAAPSWTADSDQVGALFGQAVGTAGDVNGDGYADVIVGAPYYDNGQADEGRAYVVHGSALGLLGAASWTAESDQASAHLGWSVGTAGNVNGDGYADVIVGAPDYDNGQANEGLAAVYRGGASGLALAPVWVAESDQADARFGYSVGTAGDVNGDGYADVIVGAPYYTNGQASEGRASVYHGSASWPSLAASWTAEDNQADESFGASVGTAGDVNGDGYADVIVGVPYRDNGQANEGRACVYHGAAAGLEAAARWTAESDQADAHFGRSVSAAGDVNGDGYADVIVGAPEYANGQALEGRAYVYHGSASGLSATPNWTAEGGQADARFGNSVGTAGDVNGDGYADVIVGAPWSSNGQASEGRAYVYYGSASGLAATASWTAESDQVGARFGISVGAAGDVNGDGFADVIVGADFYNNGQSFEGRAFLYLGSASGLAATPSWTAESDQGDAWFGNRVGTAGDVNGDGYADVIVGAFHYTNGQSDEGRAYVYHGSALGLALAPNWTAEGDQANAWFGASVGTAGDVNGDGFADVIVGAYRYTGGQQDEGRAYVYHGSASGLVAAPSWTAEGNQADGWFGYSVGTAGDLNGDGFADVIVGASYYDNGQQDEGRAYVYHGSASGLAAAPNWTAESDAAFTYFGASVGTAGDVNGDAFADVIVGADYYHNAQQAEGGGFVYYGNSAGRRARPRQLRSDGSGLRVQPWGASWSGDGFSAQLTNTSPEGRQRVKLQVEVCPNAIAFGDPACTTATSPSWTDVTTISTGVTLTQAMTGLSSGTLYRWRARTLYAPYSVTQPGITEPSNPTHGPWRRLSGQGQEADARVLDPDLIFADGFETGP